MRTALAVALLLSLTAGAEAGLFGGRAKRPRAVDSPRVRPKVEEAHKIGYSSKAHPAKVQRIEWGSDWKRLKKPQRAPRGHYLFD
jgi:hypothetical protein